MCLKSEIFPPKIETLFSSLANCPPYRITSTLRRLFCCAHWAWGINFSLQKNWGKVSQGWGVVSVLYSTTTITQHNHKTCRCRPHHGTTNLPWRVGFCTLFGQPMPIAAHPLIGHNVPYWSMHDNWHGLAKMAIERHHHEQQCKAAGCALSLSLSLVDNIKFIHLITPVTLTCNSIILLSYVRSSSPAILDGSVSWPSNVQSLTMCDNDSAPSGSMVLLFLRSSCSSHLPWILPSIADTYFWLVVPLFFWSVADT